MKISYCCFAIFLMIIFPFNYINSQTQTKLNGTTSDQGFSIKDNLNNTLLKVTNDGNVGIGVTNPTKKLEVNGSIGWGAGNAALTGDQGASIELRGTGTPYIDFSNDLTSDYKARLILNSNNILEVDGNVGIGTANTNGYKLAVGGNVVAEEVVVKLKENWPDYVFSKNYKKTNLDELENYIHEKGHLPNMPDAKEISTQGVNVGEVQAKLLEKIEELTLYLIDQNKKIEKLENDVAALKKKVAGD